MRYGTLFLWVGFFYFFWKIGDPFPVLSKEHGAAYLGVLCGVV